MNRSWNYVTKVERFFRVECYNFKFQRWLWKQEDSRVKYQLYFPKLFSLQFLFRFLKVANILKNFFRYGDLLFEYTNNTNKHLIENKYHPFTFPYRNFDKKLIILLFVVTHLFQSIHFIRRSCCCWWWIVRSICRCIAVCSAVKERKESRERNSTVK